MLTVRGRKSSPNVQAVMWCIGELGLAYRRHDVGHSYGGTDTPAFLAMNPNGTIPVLRDGDGPPLWETGAILRYLSSRYATASFWPPDPLARAEVDTWAEFTVPIFLSNPIPAVKPQAAAANVRCRGANRRRIDAQHQGIGVPFVTLGCRCLHEV
jgi:glutathione S-transferase